jgi:FkbM family methyltransferase
MLKFFFKNKFPKIFYFVKKIYYYFYNQYFFKKSYSIEGEDLVLNNFMGNKKKGFYVDVGAHHPMKFSNTYLFYKKGWNGINIDAMPGSMKEFNKKRKRDVNLEISVSLNPQELKYYIFEEGAYNTFSQKLAERNKNITRLLKTVTLKTQTLSDILSDHVIEGENIDFFTIDVEGYDLEVLESNDWSRYKPNFILVEQHDFNLEKFDTFAIYDYLHSKGYHLLAKTGNTVFFKL